MSKGTDHTVLRGSCTQLLHKLREKRDEEWHTGDSYDRLIWKIERVEAFQEYVKLHRRFN